MTIETGDRYLDLLSTFIEEKTGLLLDGALLLKLNPVGLNYVQTRLDALEELEGLRVGAPVEYLRAYVADLGDYRALEQLRRVLRLLSSLKVVAMVPAPSRDPTPITLLPFSRLRFLELRDCDLSTSAARGLLELRPTLEKLVCCNSADALRHIFSERTKEIQGAPVWSRLADVSCFGNGMLLMDASLQLLPAVEALDLSRNRFAKLANLQKCLKLKYVDAGYNNITNVANLNQILHCVTKLVLRHNAVISTRGLHRIASLEALDLSYNLISNFREVELLGELPSLRFLWLEGNPITFGRWYRREALSYFREPSKFVLDGKQTTMWETYAARRIVGRRLKQRSKYGAFTPAQTCKSSDLSSQLSDSVLLDAKENRAESSSGSGLSSPSSALRAKKKNSRLASIVEITGTKATRRTVESLRKSSVNSLASLDSASPVQSVVESKKQSEETVQDLIQRAEVLKRVGSTGWLKDLTILLETEGEGPPRLSEKDDTSQQSLWQKRKSRRRSLRKGSLGEPTSSEKSGNREDHEETNLASFARQSVSRRTSNDAEARCGSSYPVDKKYLKVLSVASSLDELQGSLVDDVQQPSSSPRYPYDLDDEGGLKQIDTSGTARLTGELVDGKILVGSSSSPPQFNQDLLRRRQTLERELLLLPPEQDDIASAYDSDTSSETVYSYLSYSSDSPLHSPSAVWHPYRFDHSKINELSSVQVERSDSEGTSQLESDIDALQAEALETRVRPDVMYSTDEVAECSGKVTTPPLHTAEGKQLAAEDLMPIVHPAEGREPARDDVIPSVQVAKGKQTGGRDSVDNSKEGTLCDGINIEQGETNVVGEDTTCVMEIKEEEADVAVGGQCPSSSSRAGNLIFKGNNSPGKAIRGGSKEQRKTRTTSMLQPKSKSSRRIVHLEALAGLSESSGWRKPPPIRGSHESRSELHRAASLGADSVAGQVTEGSLTSSVQYSNPFTITRTFSADANLENREWSRSRSQEDALASTSLQKGDSHEAAESGLQFHRLHHVMGPFVGQCA